MMMCVFEGGKNTSSLASFSDRNVNQPICCHVVWICLDMFGLMVRPVRGSPGAQKIKGLGTEVFQWKVPKLGHWTPTIHLSFHTFCLRKFSKCCIDCYSTVSVETIRHVLAHCIQFLLHIRFHNFWPSKYTVDVGFQHAAQLQIVSSCSNRACQVNKQSHPWCRSARTSPKAKGPWNMYQ